MFNGFGFGGGFGGSYGGGFGGFGLVPNSGGGAAPSSAIVLGATVWGFGASSMQGAQQAASGSGGTEDCLTNVVRAIEGLAPGDITGYTVSTSGGNRTARPVDYNLTGVNSAFQLRNRGVGGASSGSGGTIVSTMSAASGGFGASDFFVLHQGDNGVSFTSPNAPEILSGGYAAMRALLSGQQFVQVVNTQNGRGSAGSLAGEPPGGAFAIGKACTLRIQQDLFPGRVFNFYETLMDRYSSPTAGELIDLSQGMSPRTYMMDDGSHQIAKGYNLQSDAVLTPVIDAWAGGTPFPLKQIVEAVAPASPAPNDVVGNIVAYGSGGSFSLDASNTQTDYAVSSGGTITRIGGTPPARDITWAAVKTSKSGRFDKVQPLIGIAERAPVGVSKLVEFDGACVMGMPDSKLANGPIITLLMRIQHFDTSVDQQFMCGANGSTGWSVTLRTSGVVEIRFRNAAFTAVDAFSKNTTGTLFSPANAPNGRWLAISIDISDPVPANRKTHLVHWVDPASPAQDLALLAGTNQPGNAGTVSINVNRSSPVFIGNRVALSAGTPMFRFRLGDFTVFDAFVDFTLLATREEVSNADGTPKAAWVTANGVTAGVTPYWRIAGNAADWRLCRITGTGVAATPGATGQYLAFNNRERSPGVPGFLATV